MTRPNEPAFPTVWQNTGDLNASAPDGTVAPPGGLVALHGLTKRELFAALIMADVQASILREPSRVIDASRDGRAEHAAMEADALIAALGRMP